MTKQEIISGAGGDLAGGVTAPAVAGPLEAIVRERAPSAHVAWCRYVTKHERPTRIVLCDSDAEGAFPVFRQPRGFIAQRPATANEFDEAIDRLGMLAGRLGHVNTQENMDEFRAAIDKEVKLMVGVVLADDFMAEDTDSGVA